MFMGGITAGVSEVGSALVHSFSVSLFWGRVAQAVPKFAVKPRRTLTI